MLAAAALCAALASSLAAATTPAPRLPARDPAPAAAQAPLLAPHNTTRVPIVLGVMSRCPDALLCESLFDGVLQQTWPLVALRLSFLGTVNASAAPYGVTCLHGPGECAGNVHELCAARAARAPQDWWSFLQCVNYEGRARVGDAALARRCAGVAALPWDGDGLRGCIAGPEGAALLRASVRQSAALGITKSCTIMISGVQRCVHDGTWQDCETGHTVEELVDYIREEYQRLQGTGASADSEDEP